MLVGAARVVMAELDGVDDPAVAEPVGLLGQVIDADTEPDPDGGGDGGLRIREGVAPDRVISVSDPQMRHGRKSSARRFDGHKMDVITDEASELVLGVDIRAGNAADGEGAIPLLDHGAIPCPAWPSTPWWATWPTPTAISGPASRPAAWSWWPRSRR